MILKNLFKYLQKQFKKTSEKTIEESKAKKLSN